MLAEVSARMATEEGFSVPDTVPAEFSEQFKREYGIAATSSRDIPAVERPVAAR